MTPCGCSKNDRRFGGIYGLHLQRNETAKGYILFAIWEDSESRYTLE
jgi:hypothetical protein